MIYFIIFLIAVVMLTLNFIAGTFETLIQLEHKTKFDFGPMTIEKVYRPVDFRYSFRYASDDYFMNHLGAFDQSIKSIHDQKHKDYIIRDAVRSLSEDMLKSGCIEISDNEMDVFSDHFHPHVKRIDMKVKVYKPE